MTEDGYIASLLRQAEEDRIRRTEGLDVDLAAELNESRQLRRDNLKRERESLRKTEMEEDIRRFKEYFPDVTAADIPEEVWAEVAEAFRSRTPMHCTERQSAQKTQKRRA